MAEEDVSQRLDLIFNLICQRTFAVQLLSLQGVRKMLGKRSFLQRTLPL